MRNCSHRGPSCQSFHHINRTRKPSLIHQLRPATPAPRQTSLRLPSSRPACQWLAPLQHDIATERQGLCALPPLQASAPSRRPPQRILMWALSTGWRDGLLLLRNQVAWFGVFLSDHGLPVTEQGPSVRWSVPPVARWSVPHWGSEPGCPR
jgi:hypothetical protein